jgi:hypothetical protein
MARSRLRCCRCEPFDRVISPAHPVTNRERCNNSPGRAKPNGKTYLTFGADTHQRENTSETQSEAEMGIA